MHTGTFAAAGQRLADTDDSFSSAPRGILIGQIAQILRGLAYEIPAALRGWRSGEQAGTCSAVLGAAGESRERGRGWPPRAAKAKYRTIFSTGEATRRSNGPGQARKPPRGKAEGPEARCAAELAAGDKKGQPAVRVYLLVQQPGTALHKQPVPGTALRAQYGAHNQENTHTQPQRPYRARRV